MKKNKKKDWREELSELILEIGGVQDIECRIADFIESLLRKKEREVVEKIVEESGEYYNDGCGCCARKSLKSELEDTYLKN